MITFNTRTNPPIDSVSLTRHALTTFSEGTLLKLFKVFYVDDGAFPFEYRDQLAKGAQLIHDNLKQFGLEMHIRKGAKSSKMECIFFLPPGFFKRNQTLPAMENSLSK